MKILAFAASNSRKSINKQLVEYAAQQLANHQVDIVDLNDYELPIYSIDIETSEGIPPAASQFLDRIGAADALLISYAEHNGNYTAVYKNLFDWMSRARRDVFQGKPIVMLSTSPGPGGAQNALNLAANSAQFFEGTVTAALSIPSFYENFDQETLTLTDSEIDSDFKAALTTVTR